MPKTQDIKICEFCSSKINITEWFDFLYVEGEGLYFCDICCCHLYIEFTHSEHL